jgi:hypothetical protein
MDTEFNRVSAWALYCQAMPTYTIYDLIMLWQAWYVVYELPVNETATFRSRKGESSSYMFIVELN